MDNQETPQLKSPTEESPQPIVFSQEQLESAIEEPPDLFVYDQVGSLIQTATEDQSQPDVNNEEPQQPTVPEANNSSTQRTPVYQDDMNFHIAVDMRIVLAFPRNIVPRQPNPRNVAGRRGARNNRPRRITGMSSPSRQIYPGILEGRTARQERLALESEEMSQQIERRVRRHLRRLMERQQQQQQPRMSRTLTAGPNRARQVQGIFPNSLLPLIVRQQTLLQHTMRLQRNRPITDPLIHPPLNLTNQRSMPVVRPRNLSNGRSAPARRSMQRRWRDSAPDRQPNYTLMTSLSPQVPHQQAFTIERLSPSEVQQAGHSRARPPQGLLRALLEGSVEEEPLAELSDNDLDNTELDVNDDPPSSQQPTPVINPPGPSEPHLRRRSRSPRSPAEGDRNSRRSRSGRSPAEGDRNSRRSSSGQSPAVGTRNRRSRMGRMPAEGSRNSMRSEPMPVEEERTRLNERDWTIRERLLNVPADVNERTLSVANYDVVRTEVLTVYTMNEPNPRLNRQ